jgi:hypothetical protein
VVGKCEGTTEAELDEMRVPFINGQAFDLSIFIAEKMVLIFLVKVRDSLFSTKTEVSQYFAMIEDITETKNADYRRIESETDFLFFLLICKQELY